MTGAVERITYQNAENGFSVIKCRAKGYSDLVTVVGNMPDVHVGSVLSMQDIGLKPPILLLGTKEANRIANEITAQRVAEEMENLFKSEENKYWKLPESLNDEDLPFN